MVTAHDVAVTCCSSGRRGNARRPARPAARTRGGLVGTARSVGRGRRLGVSRSSSPPRQHRAFGTGGWWSGDVVMNGDRQALAQVLSSSVPRLNADPDRVERGLAQLVLTIVDLLRELMERQAIRRMEAGTITDEQIEALGTAFLRLAERMEELKSVFGLEQRDLDLGLDLGNLRGIR